MMGSKLKPYMINWGAWHAWLNAPNEGLATWPYFVGPWSPFIISLAYDHLHPFHSQQLAYRKLVTLVTSIHVSINLSSTLYNIMWTHQVKSGCWVWLDMGNWLKIIVSSNNAYNFFFFFWVCCVCVCVGGWFWKLCRMTLTWYISEATNYRDLYVCLYIQLAQQ